MTPTLEDAELAVLDSLEMQTRSGRADGFFVSARILKPRGVKERGFIALINTIDGALSRLERLGFVERRHEGHRGQEVPEGHEGYYAILWRVVPARVVAVNDLLADWRGRPRATKRSRPSSLADSV